MSRDDRPLLPGAVPGVPVVIGEGSVEGAVPSTSDVVRITLISQPHGDSPIDDTKKTLAIRAIPPGK